MSDVDGARLPEFDDVLGASQRLAGHSRRTPLLADTPLDASTGGRILLKLETLQHTGSFKFRGAYNRLAQIRQIDAARVSSRSRRAITHRAWPRRRACSAFPRRS